MRGFQWNEYEKMELSVAMTGALDEELAEQMVRGTRQEDLTFAYWRPSEGGIRCTAIIHALALPRHGDRILHGNVAFTQEYVSRVLDDCQAGQGIALLHGHLGPGWQDMSDDDVVAERDRLAGLVAGRTGLPLVGMTWGTDGTWSGRFWLRTARHQYAQRWVSTVRAVGTRVRLDFHPDMVPEPPMREAQVSTRSVWGEKAQSDLARTHVGIVGLGSVGSIVAEALSRSGVSRITLIDHDVIEERNLDRTLGAVQADVVAGRSKVGVSARLLESSHTAELLRVRPIASSLLTQEGMTAALDCDVLISCVDRPFPRHVLNNLAYQHLIPVIDGGILARVDQGGRLLHVDWRIHTVGPAWACLYCLDALRRSDVALDRDGMLDDPDYIERLPLAERERYQRRNVFAFSLSVAAHEFLQLVTLLTGNPRIGGGGPQRYDGYPGEMSIMRDTHCQSDCDVVALTGTAGDLLRM